MASSLRILFKGSTVIAPDIPIEPSAALELIEGICRQENPDLVVGLSLGGFLAQKLRGRRKLLVNPDLHASRFLRSKLGINEYLSPRLDGAAAFTVTEETINEYVRLEAVEFDGITPEEQGLTFGAFAEHDELVDCREEFLAHYPGHALSYPGGHLPVFPELKNYIKPYIEEVILI